MELKCAVIFIFLFIQHKREYEQHSSYVYLCELLVSTFTTDYATCNVIASL